MCFSLEWLKQVLIWCVIIGAIIAFLQLVVPWVLSKLPQKPALAEAINMIAQVFWICVYAAIVIFVIYIVFDLIQCLINYGGGFPSLPRR